MSNGTQTVNVDTKHPLYDERVKLPADLVEDCITGELAMRKRLIWPGVTPMRQTATHRHRMAGYQARAAFVNATRRTMNAWAGIVMATPPSLNVPTGQLAPLEDDADGNGQPLLQLIRDALTEILKNGRALLLPVYSLPIQIGENGEIQQTNEASASVAEKSLRLHYDKEIINWRTVGGSDSLIVIRYKDNLDDPSGFTNTEVTIWHELRMVDGKAYQRRWWAVADASPVTDITPTSGPASVGVTALEPIIINGQILDYLPVAWIGAVNNDSYPDESPLFDIASLNEKHYMVEADLAELTHLVSLPTLIATNMTQSDADKMRANGVMLGSDTAIPLTGNAKLEMLQAEERNGVIALAERREKQMALIGAQLIENTTGTMTATQADYNAQSDTSSLSTIAANVESAFNKAFEILGAMTGADDNDPVVSLNKQYITSQVDPQSLTAMMQLVQAGEITQEDFIRWMMRNNVIEANGRTVDEIVTEVKDQAPTITPVTTPAATGKTSATSLEESENGEGNDDAQ